MLTDIEHGDFVRRFKELITHQHPRCGFHGTAEKRMIER